jgi:hypothetical protein
MKEFMTFQEAMEYCLLGGKVYRTSFGKGVYVFIQDKVLMVKRSDGRIMPAFFGIKSIKGKWLKYEPLVKTDFGVIVKNVKAGCVLTSC